MAGLKLEGNFDNVSERQLGYIKEVVEKRGFKDVKVILEPVGQAGDNYVANVKRVVVQDKNGPIFKMIAKIAPTIEQMRVVGSTELLFKNEHIMYTRVLPKFEQLQIGADVPVEERMKYAACYGSLQEAPNEVILLEDLNLNGFEMLDRFKSLSNECIRSVLKNFALLHSFSYALKKKEPELFEEYKTSLFDMWSNMGAQEDVKSFMLQLENSAIMVLDNDKHKRLLKGILSESMPTFAKLANSDRNSKHAVIQQGDSWTNNLMFKFEEGVLRESIMIDYQISKAANPVLDLHYMIFNCTDYPTRKEHFYDWLDYYHNELDKCLSTFGLKANYVYPKDQLDVDMKRYGKMCMGQSVMLASMLILKPAEALKVKEAMENADINKMAEFANVTNLGGETLTLFKTRVEGLLDSYIEFGFVL